MRWQNGVSASSHTASVEDQSLPSLSGTQNCLCRQWMKLHSTSKSLEILCQKSLREPIHMVSGWEPSTSSPAPATHLGSVPSMGLTLLGAPPPFPSQGDPLHYKPQGRRPSRLKSPPWSLGVSQGWVPHASCSPNSARFRLCALQVCLEDVLQPFQPSALSVAGVSGHVTPCTVEEPLAGWVSLDLNAYNMYASA